MPARRRSGTTASSPWRRTRLVAGLPVLALALVLGLTGCGSSRYTYVTNKSDDTFLKVPSDWSHFRRLGPAFVGLDAKNVSPEYAALIASREWVVGLDASKPANKDALYTPTAGQPNGFVQVRHLTPEEADSLSAADLRNQLLDVDTAEQEQQKAVAADPQGARITPTFEMLDSEDVTQAGGVHGIHQIFQAHTASGLTTVDQTSLLDKDSTTLYQLVLMCSAECYAQNRTAVQHVQSSFTIKHT